MINDQVKFWDAVLKIRTDSKAEGCSNLAVFMFIAICFLVKTSSFKSVKHFADTKRDDNRIVKSKSRYLDLLVRFTYSKVFKTDWNVY